MDTNIVGLYLLWARRRPPNRKMMKGIGARAAEMKPKVEIAHAPVKLVITELVC